MMRHSGIILVLALLGGCENDEAPSPPKAPTTTEGAPTAAIGALKVKEDFERSAEEAITEDNLEAAVRGLEEEIKAGEAQ